MFEPMLELLPINKNALLRYRALDRCIRNKGKVFTVTDLLDTVNDALSIADFKLKGLWFNDLYDKQVRGINR